jgi:hypothetical protein
MGRFRQHYARLFNQKPKNSPKSGGLTERFCCQNDLRSPVTPAKYAQFPELLDVTERRMKKALKIRLAASQKSPIGDDRK